MTWEDPSHTTPDLKAGVSSWFCRRRAFRAPPALRKRESARENQPPGAPEERNTSSHTQNISSEVLP
jgi:hypothetical protein